MTARPLTLTDYREAYAAGRLTPADAVRDVYARIEAHADPAIFITLRPMADLLAEAAALAGGPDNPGPARDWNGAAGGRLPPDGLLVEAEAVRTAEDISALGGWRNYLGREHDLAGA